MKSSVIDLTMHLHADTLKALLVSDDGERKSAVWVAKQHCEIDPPEDAVGKTVTVTMPEWLAIEKGLV